MSLKMKDIFEKREERVFIPFIEARQQFNRRMQYRVCAVTLDSRVPLIVSHWGTFAPANQLKESIDHQIDAEMAEAMKRREAEREARRILNHTPEPPTEEIA
jgi:hypothetical protein